MSKHYDVVVLGAGIGALAAAALLSRRSWRVLVLGQGYRPPAYTYDGLTLARRPFTMLAASSPAWSRVLAELAQSQTFHRRVSPLDPMLQVMSPGRRLDLPPEAALFGREIDREFPGVRRVVDELYAELARTNAAADAAFERDAVWPPGGFWERREIGRILSAVPHVLEDHDLLAEFPRDHAYRAVVDVPARFASDLAGPLVPFAAARLQGAWARGVVRLARGEEELTEFLAERVRAHAGEVNLRERAVAIVHRGGKVTGVVIDGDETPVGVQFVVTDLPTRSLLDLAVGYTPSRRVLASLPLTVVRARRFVVSVIARARGVPESLAAESFLIPKERTARPMPIVHLQRLPTGDPETTLLVAEMLLEEEGTAPLASAREAVLATIEEFLPFVERHYLVADSPHDGRPLWDYRGGERRDVDRARFRASGASIEREATIPQWEIDPPQLYGLGGEALRAPIGNGFIVGRTAMPALGQEGELLAAWSAARLITRTDRRKEKMRRDMWSKVELG